MGGELRGSPVCNGDVRSNLIHISALRTVGALLFLTALGKGGECRHSAEGRISTCVNRFNWNNGIRDQCYVFNQIHNAS
ncbi:hypothetical protein D3C85_1436300 [compost metagenome]